MSKRHMDDHESETEEKRKKTTAESNSDINAVNSIANGAATSTEMADKRSPIKNPSSPVILPENATIKQEKESPNVFKANAFSVNSNEPPILGEDPIPNDNAEIKIKEEPHNIPEKSCAQNGSSDEAEITILLEINYYSEKPVRSVKRKKTNIDDEDDIICLGEFPVKIKQEEVVDIEDPYNIIESNSNNVTENGESNVEKNLNKQKEGDSDILSHCIIKNEVEDMEEGSENIRTDNVSEINGVNTVENDKCSLEKNANSIVGTSRLIIKREESNDDTLNAVNNKNNLEVANAISDCLLVAIKAENDEKQSHTVPSSSPNDSTELTSKEIALPEALIAGVNALSEALIADVNEPLVLSEALIANANESIHWRDLDEPQVDPVFSSDSQRPFDFNCLNNKKKLTLVKTEDEELYDTAPSTPVNENDHAFELTPEHIAYMSLLLEAEPRETHLNGETATVTDETSELLNVDDLKHLDFKSKIDCIDLINCSMVLTIIMKKLENGNTNPSSEEVSFQECIKNTFLVYTEDGADDILNPRPITPSISSTEEYSSRDSITPSSRHIPAYPLSRRESAIYETPETGGFDKNAVRCLEFWGKDDIRKVIQPTLNNGISGEAETTSRNDTQMEDERLTCPLVSLQSQSSVANSIPIVSKPLPKKRSYPGNEPSEPVISSPTQINMVPASTSGACRKKLPSISAEVPAKIQRKAATAPEIPGNFGERANPGLINDPLNPSRFNGLEKDGILLAEPSSRNVGGIVKDLREFLNRRNNAY